MQKPELIELKYLSEAQEGMNIWGLTAIVDTSVVSNEQNSITGILFFDNGFFGQVLEGPRIAVMETWGRIQKDSRHHNIELLGITEIQERRFPKWSIKLFDAQHFLEAFPQYSDLIAQISNPDIKTLQVLRSLWREV